VRGRDRLRGEHLQRLGWRYHRLWSTNWFRHPDDEVVKLQEAYERAVAAAEPEEAAPPDPAFVYQDRQSASRGQRPSGSDGQQAGRAGRTDPLTASRTCEPWAAARTSEPMPARQTVERPPAGQTMATGTGRAELDHRAGPGLALGPAHSAGTEPADRALRTEPSQAHRALDASPERPGRALETEPPQVRPALDASPDRPGRALETEPPQVRPALEGTPAHAGAVLEAGGTQASAALEVGGTQASAALDSGRSPFGPLAPPELPPADPSES
jgi:hypothetical protein